MSFSLYAQNYSKSDVKVVLNRSDSIMNSIENISYDGYSTVFTNYTTDTFHFYSRVTIVPQRKAKHLYKSLIRQEDVANDYLVIFNGDTVSFNNKEKKQTEISLIAPNGDGMYGYISGTSKGNVVIYDWIRDSKIYTKKLKRKKFPEEINLKDSIINNEKVKVLNYTSHWKKDKETVFVTFAFRDFDGFPIYKKEVRHRGKEEVTTIISLKNIQINQKLDDDIFNVKKSIPSDYTIEIYDREKKTKRTPVIANNMTAPHFSLKSINGENIDLSDYKGKIVVLDFWFAGCFPCRELTPKLLKLKEKYPDVIFLGINPLDEQPTAEKYLDLLGIKNTSINILSDKISKDYQVTVFPTVIVIDKNGVINHSFLGSKDSDIEILEKIIKSELNK